MPRLFIALDLPDDTKDQLAPLLDYLSIPGAHPIHTEDLHITLRFIGEVSGAEQKAIQAELLQIHRPRFQLKVNGVSPNTNSLSTMRVLWCNVQTIDDRLKYLQREIETRINGLGYEPEERKFTPHITLARIKKPPARSALDLYLGRFSGFFTQPFTVTQFTLYSSELTPDGAIYTPEQIYPLG